MNRPLLAAQWLVRVGLALLFAYAGAQKLLDPSGLARDIENYRIVPEPLVGPLALAVPVLELVTAAALLTGPYLRGAAVLATGMLAVFAVAMAQAKLRGIDLECGCFGAASQSQVSWRQVARNLGLAILSAWLLWPRPLPATAPGQGTS
jgi:uncharacterized membrane protein YphA (DoxX/SURF4 family)